MFSFLLKFWLLFTSSVTMIQLPCYTLSHWIAQFIRQLFCKDPQSWVHFLLSISDNAIIYLYCLLFFSSKIVQHLWKFSTCMSSVTFITVFVSWKQLLLIFSLFFFYLPRVKLFTEKVKDKLSLTLQSHILKTRVRLLSAVIIVEP